MSGLKKKSLAAFLLLLFVIGLGHLCYHKTGGFQPCYLMPAAPSLQLATAQLKEKLLLDKILAQKWRYLGSGNQAFAFVSEDGMLCLKLFKNEYIHRTPLTYAIPPIPPFRDFFLHRGEEHESRKAKLLLGYQVAYENDRENCGLLYYHPFALKDAAWTAVLQSGCGQQFQVDLNHYVFAVQQKAIPAKQELNKLLSHDHVDQAKHRLLQIIRLYQDEFSRSICDCDYNFLDNTSFLKTRAIRHDVGKIVKDPRLTSRSQEEEYMKKIAEERLGGWLKRRFPHYHEELTSFMLENTRIAPLDTRVNNSSRFLHP